MRSSPYDRPILPWVLAVAAYAWVAGLVALLSLVVSRSVKTSGGVWGEEGERIAADLAALRARRPISRSREFDSFIVDYLQDPRVLVCPEIQRHVDGPYWPASERVEDDVSYCIVRGTSARDPSRWVVAFDEEWNHLARGGHALHVDGHVEWMADGAALEGAIARQLDSPRADRRGDAIGRPWWSRPGERPPFVTDAQVDDASSVPTVIWGALLSVGAVVLLRLARGTRPRLGGQR